MSLNGKIALITGGSDGIGAGVAILFAKEGASVAIVGRNEEKLKKVATECQKYGHQVLIIKAELTKENDVKSAVKQTIDKFGKLDLLINNAGIGKKASILDENILETYDEIMNLNMRSVVQITNLAAPYLVASKGSIVNVSSVGGKTRIAGLFVYCVSKAALDHFTRCIASELAPKGVRVNSVNPGPVRTNFANSVVQNESEVEAFWEGLKSLTVLNRVSDVDEIASMIAYLASDKARGITGSSFVVDNGRLLK